MFWLFWCKMNRTSTKCIVRNLVRTNSVVKWDFSSSFLQTIHSPNSKPALNPLYNLLPPTQNPNNIVNLICSALRTDKTHLSLLQNDIKSILPHLGPAEISRVLLRCQSDFSSALDFFNWVKTDLGLKPTNQNYCHVAHILVWSQQFSPAMKLLSELIGSLKRVSPREDIFHTLVSCTENCNWNPVIFDMLIKAYVTKGMVREGFVTFGKTLDFGLVPNVVCCNFLLNGLARVNCVELCWTVFEEMLRIRINPNRHTFNTLTHLLCKFGDVNKVNAFIEKMEEHGFEPDVVTYNILISSHSQKGKLEEAMYLYKIMYRRNVIPDLVTYTCLMNGFCRKGRLKEAHQIFHRMVNRGLEPDVVSYNTLISGYCEEGKLLESRWILNSMIGNGICPNNLTCKLLVRGYQREGKLISALNLVADFERLGIHVSSDNYDFLMVSLCREDRPFAAKSLWERISEEGHYKPNLVIYNELIQSLCRCDYGSEALLAKEVMLQRCFKPGPMVYKALIDCLFRTGRSIESELLVKEMVESGLSPDSEICRALVCGYCRESDFDKAESVLIYFAKDFGVCDTESYNEVVRVLGKHADVAKLLDFHDQMQKYGFTPNSLTCKYVIQGLHRSKRDDSMNEEL